MSDSQRYILTKGNTLLEVEIQSDGGMQIVGCYLKTDSWEDYEAFKAQATEAQGRGDRKLTR